MVACLLALAGCAKFGSGSGDDPDAAIGGLIFDSSPGADAAPELGSEARPAASCAEMRDAGFPSGVAWVVHPDQVSPAFQVYCEQELGGGGWAMLYNSVLRLDGTTTAFWQFDYAQRLGTVGSASPDQNYYQGSLYLIGTEYMDIFTDVDDTTAVAVTVAVEGFDQGTMAFIAPTLTTGNPGVFNAQFAAGWSSADHDGDTYAENCATLFGSVAQHYSACWAYNLGADADGAPPFLDGGVGPHVNNTILTQVGLVPVADGGSYSRVNRIARLTRW